jgi:hypothetical protein
MTKLARLLREIQSRPGMFLEETAITSISDFFTGYMVATTEKDEAADLLANGFNEWIGKKYKQWPTPRGWRLILLEVAGDERAAFDLFFLDFNEFLAQSKSANDR